MATQRTDPPLAASEVDTLRGYLAYHRDTMRMKTEGLDPRQLAQVHPPSTMTLGGLLKHLALNEDWWFIQVLEGRESEASWVVPGALDDDPDWEWHSAVDDSPEELRRIFDETTAAADAAIDRALAEAGLDATSMKTSQRDEGKPFTLRWLLLHMIEEYARHNGHADMLREAVDGQVGE
jgi:uncharacterized damage-inducible protein DinB